MKVGRWGWIVPVVLVGSGSCQRKEEQKGGDVPGEGALHVLARAGHRLPVGATLTTTHALALTDAKMAIERGGKKVVGTMEMTTESELRMEIISERVTRITVVKDIQSVTHSVAGAGQPGKPVVNPLQGMAVTFTRTGGQWIGKLESGDASEEQAAKIEWLAGHLDDEDAIGMYGTAPRRVGEEWEVDPQEASLVGTGADFEGTFRLRFDRVEEFAGTPCAVLLGTINVSGKLDSEGGGGGEIKIVVPRAVIYRSLETLENLKSEFAGELFKAEYPEPGESAVVRGRLSIVQGSTVARP